MNVTKKIILLLAICCMMCMGSMDNIFAQKGQSVSHVTLRIRVNNIESNEGRIMIAVYNTADSFLMNAFKVMSVPVDSVSKAPVSLSLPAGVYAISLFQDANNNGVLDTGTFGIPIEKYGFSNDAEGVMGPPSFKSCSFNLKEDTIVSITLR